MLLVLLAWEATVDEEEEEEETEEDWPLAEEFGFGCQAVDIFGVSITVDDAGGAFSRD